MDAVAVLNRLSELGITVRTDGVMVLMELGSRVPPDLKDAVRQNKPEIMALVSSAWPPPDAEELINMWDELGFPEIPLSPGITVSNLRIWFRATGIARRAHDGPPGSSRRIYLKRTTRMGDSSCVHTASISLE